MKIEIKTDGNGHENITLVDVPKYGARPKGIPTKHILIRACDGHVFHAPPSLRGLSTLSEAEAECVKFYLEKLGGPCKPNVFAGNEPSD